MKVAICIPSYDSWAPEFGTSLVFLVAHTLQSPVDLQIHTEIGTSIDYARFSLAQKALSQGADYLMWIDADQTFPADTLVQLLSHQKDIVGAVYSARRFTQRGVVGRCFVRGDVPDFTAPGLVELSGLGFGCVLIHRRVFEAVPSPWFGRYSDQEEAQDPWAGEDYRFCTRAIKAGFKIWMDAPLSRCVGHVGRFTYTLDAQADVNRLLGAKLQRVKS